MLAGFQHAKQLNCEESVEPATIQRPHEAIRRTLGCVLSAGLSAIGDALGAFGYIQPVLNRPLHAMQVTHEKDSELATSAQRLQALEAAQHDAADSAAAREAALSAQLR